MMRLLLFLVMTAATSTAHAQGCAQCRDNSAALPYSTQAAYRHAIILLIVTAGGIFTGTVVMLRRSR